MRPEVPLSTSIASRQKPERRVQAFPVDRAREGIARIGLNVCLLAANRAYAEMLGVKPEQVIGRSWETGVAPPQQGAVLAMSRRMLIGTKADCFGKTCSKGRLAPAVSCNHVRCAVLAIGEQGPLLEERVNGG